MKNFRIIVNRFSSRQNVSASTTQREHWTQDILSLMMIVILAAAVIISVGILAGYFDFIGSSPIYVVLILILPAWWGARHGGWRWASYFPILLCFFLGAYSSYFNGFHTGFVLFYAIAVLLAGILHGLWLSWFFVLASVVSMTVLALRLEGAVLSDILPSLITDLFALVGISLLQLFVDARLWHLLAEQVQGNQQLQREIARREQAEAVQRDQESQLLRLADNTSDMVVEIDPLGTIRYVSPSHLAGLGYRPEDLLGTNAYQLIHPDDVERAMAAAQQASESGQPSRLQIRYRHANGQYIHLEISGTVLYDRDHRFDGFVLASRDITLQKLAEAALQESEQKFRNIIEALPFGVHMYHLDERDELILTGYNPAAQQILGVDHATLLGKTILSAFPGLAHTDIPQGYRGVARQGGRWDTEQILYSDQTINGTYEVHAVQTSSGKIVAIFSEISSRIRADEALRLSEEKFSKAFLTSPDSINLNRLRDGVYLDINQGFTRIMGYTREDVLGKSSLDLNIWVDPADRAHLVKALREKGEMENLEADFRRKDGSIVVGLMSARLIEIEGEHCILSITRDITERQQAELELRQAHIELGQAYEATLQGWARALEMRERATADHSRRVVDLTLGVARALGIDGEELLNIQRGALLHDIGKMGVPDAILLKPAPLTSDEWVTMRQHPQFAYTLLNDIDYLRPAMEIPYAHHEHWDGSGYPRGIRGDEIPLAARIFAVVDVYDALLSDRPYRPAWSEPEVRRYLIGKKGTQFDPGIVDLFLELVFPG